MMRRRLDPEVRKKEILKSAARAFANQPFDEVQVTEIARDAGASRALVNHYFGDKRGLFLAVVEEMTARVPSRIHVNRGLEPEALLAANTRAWMDMVEENREVTLLFLEGPLSADPQVIAIKDGIRDRAANRILRDRFGDEEVPPVAHRAMRAATGLIERALRDWLTGRGGSREETEAMIVQSILAVVGQVIPALAAGAPGPAEAQSERPATGRQAPQRSGRHPLDSDPLGAGPSASR